MKHGLDSATMRRVLTLIQQAALRGERAPTVRQIAHAEDKSTSTILRYIEALRAGGYITYAERSAGTIRIKEWL